MEVPCDRGPAISFFGARREGERFLSYYMEDKAGYRAEDIHYSSYEFILSYPIEKKKESKRK